MTNMLDFEAFRQTPLNTAPYDYLVVENFIQPDCFGGISADFPVIDGTGSYPPDTLDIQGQFAGLLEQLDGKEFRDMVSEKFNIALDGLPTIFTVRGRCDKKNGKIHRDSESKIITVLLYLNDADWQADGGRLRILNSADDLTDMVEEINPNGGTLLVFRRSENSWHGHEPFEGVRRAVQMNWVTGQDVVEHELRRHRLSAFIKNINPFRSAGA